jgi:tellurite resistance protein
VLVPIVRVLLFSRVCVEVCRFEVAESVLAVAVSICREDGGYSSADSAEHALIEDVRGRADLESR